MAYKKDSETGSDIVITEFMDPAVVAALRQDFRVDYDPDMLATPQEIPLRLSHARALIVRNRTQVGDALLATAPKLQCVGRLGVGLDNIDMPMCMARGIKVYPALGSNRDSVAEYVITTLLVLRRGAYHKMSALLDGAWPRDQLVGREARGCTLGLIGFGDIARAVAACARALGITVCATDPGVAADDSAWELATRLDCDTLLQTCDAVSLHVPLTPETTNFINADRLALMPARAILINTSRGAVIDQPAVAAALQCGRLSGAALDVFDPEPPTREAMAAFEAFRDSGNLILTPHIAGVTEESNQRASAMVAAYIRSHLDQDAVI